MAAKAGYARRYFRIRVLRTTRLLTLLLVLLPVEAISWPGAVLESSADNTLYLSEPDQGPSQNELSNGSGWFLFSGRTGLDGGFRPRRALLRFDLSTIPEGSEILYAELVLYQSNSAPGSPPSVMTLHRVLQAWGEGGSDAVGPEGQGALADAGDATWISRIYGDEKWEVPGGHYHDAISAAATVGSFEGQHTWPCSQTMLDDLNGWISQPEENFGWVLIGAESGGMNAHRFNSREHFSPDTRPQLILVYAPPGILQSDGFESEVTCQP